MKKDYYTSWTHGEKKTKLARALLMIGDCRVSEVAQFTGVPKSIITKAAHEMGISKMLSDDGKYPLLVGDYYDNFVPFIPEETKEERAGRVQEAMLKLSSSHTHEKHFTRCSTCMKILGSELHFVRIDDVLAIIKQVEIDLSDNDPSCDMERSEMAMLLEDRIYKTITYQEEL